MASALALLLLLLPLAPAAPALALSDAQQLVVEAWRLVNQSYVDPERFSSIHWRNLRQKALEQPIRTSVDAYDAIDALLAPLGDPYTKLLRPSDYANLRSSTQGQVSGVGLQLGLRREDGAVVVIAPVEGSPAAEAKIASGSELLTVDGIPSQSLGLDGTAARLRGPDQTRVLLRLRPPQGGEREVELPRRNLVLVPVRSLLLPGEGGAIGYVRISQFSEPVPRLVREALEALSAQGSRGLILDLRNNSGGLVSAGLAVANGLLAGQPIVETVNRDGLSSTEQASTAQLYAGPMLTLVNGGTASASEILAGALQDNGRSPLFGSRTFGKGLIQTLIPLGDGSGLAVTVARYRTPGGRDIQNQGIAPDQELPQPEPLAPGQEGDTWLQQAELWLRNQLISQFSSELSNQAPAGAAP
ncbi:MAG: S41 family peptidase [Prochlorococcaceae cyanobacterium]